MVSVKSVKIDGEDIYIFNSALYIFESSSGSTLELDMIVGEVTLNKYKNRETIIIETELEDGRIINSFMYLKTLPGKLPRLTLFCDLDEMEEYKDFQRVHENDLEFPNVEEGITLEEIRKVEMPNEKITIKLKLPINQVEWLNKQSSKELNVIFKELIDEYLKR